MATIKSRTITHKDPEVLAELRKDYELLGFVTGPIKDNSFVVYTSRAKEDKKGKRKK